MNRGLVFAIGFLCGAVVAVGIAAVHRHLREGMHHSHAVYDAGTQAGLGQEAGRAHTEERFSFTANGTMDEAAPLFGADKERVWSPEWKPNFVHPMPAGDEEGMVFTVAHEHAHASWVNTQFDLKNGRIQYVYMIPDAMVTVITLKLTPDGKKTHVEVEYDRTALSAEADDHVRHMAEGDRKAGPEWEQQVNDYLRKKAAK